MIKKHEPLERRCDLCRTVQEEIFAYEKADNGVMHRVRKGWVCWECWPAAGSFHQAILRERWVCDDKSK